MNYRIRNFHAGDAIKIINTALRDEDQWIKGTDWAKTAMTFEIMGPAYTLTDDTGVILACAGVAIVRDGVGEAWTLFSSLIGKRFISVHRIVRREMERIMDIYGLMRIQAPSRAVSAISPRWLPLLGFKKEGLMKKYIDGEDYYMFAVVR
jgi:hypothetical protein